MTTTHPTFDRLGDLADGFADGTATGDERAAIEAHVGSCAECAEVVRGLRALLAEAGAAPREVEPPAEAWEGIRAEIERRRVRPIAATAAGASGATRSLLARHGRLAAAMLVVAAMSSATTAVVMRRGDPPPSAVVAEAERAPATNDAARAAALPIAFRAAEAEYLRTARELAAALERGRATLAPQTVATVERSLRTIDDAIGEARDALLRDPANGALQELLAGHYERKLDLLKRAAELSSTS